MTYEEKLARAQETIKTLIADGQMKSFSDEGLSYWLEQVSELIEIGLQSDEPRLIYIAQVLMVKLVERGKEVEEGVDRLTSFVVALSFPEIMGNQESGFLM